MKKKKNKKNYTVEVKDVRVYRVEISASDMWEAREKAVKKINRDDDPYQSKVDYDVSINEFDDYI